jgi:hypothetical protein
MMHRYARNILATLSALLVIINPAFAGVLPNRSWATGTITTIPTQRIDVVLGYLGNETVRTEGPNFGMIIWNLLAVYADSIGMIAYVIMFAIPFIMMWIVNSDMTLPSIVGMIFSIYCFARMPQQYILFSTGCFVICIAALMWSLYRRSY